jgi:hypothetical protein
MPFPCHAMLVRVYIVSFPFDLHSAAMFDSPMPCPCHATTIPFWKWLLKATAQCDMGTGWAWHGMCELASAVQRRHVGDLSAFGFFRLPCRVPWRLFSEHTNPLIWRTRSSDISGYYVDFHEGHALLENGRGAAWHGRGMAWALHGTCELACRDLIICYLLMLHIAAGGMV